ncbi:DUF3800 domain-containing protein [Bacillus aerolatus]|uniref:DUF3800 domain-containing protein n=1 Tax=Bacillus aerolatus TaxID=2653354 RepID=A0A6I1FGK4_9BACI|nr:DUF3800 domain-containing protein [Bacillus aerolatus]KAB7704904.1 DUF3800 domain-containing protein [Bacillus aerolatus]
MSKYFLFLDESTTHSSGFNNPVFCVAGFIIKEEDYEKILIPKLDELKSKIWQDLANPTSIVLHEKEIREAQNRMHRINTVKPHFQRFRQNGNSRLLFSELSKLFQALPCTIIGACIDMDSLKNHFDPACSTETYLTAMQIILENYCHFLHKNNGIGYVFAESRAAQDTAVRMHFNHVKAMGSMFVSPHAMQTYLREIEFPPKSSNNPGLQVADFIPNPFARNALQKKQNKFNVYKEIRKLRYEGGLKRFDRFGIKIMP